MDTTPAQVLFTQAIGSNARCVKVILSRRSAGHYLLQKQLVSSGITLYDKTEERINTDFESEAIETLHAIKILHELVNLAGC